MLFWLQKGKPKKNCCDKYYKIYFKIFCQTLKLLENKYDLVYVSAYFDYSIKFVISRDKKKKIQTCETCNRI